MSPHITTRKKYAEHQRHNEPYEASMRVVSLNAFLLAAAVCAAIGYVVLLNVLVSRGYALKQFTERAAALAGQQEKLERDLAAQRSPERLALEVPAMGLTDARQLSYALGSPAVAKADTHGVE